MIDLARQIIELKTKKRELDAELSKVSDAIDEASARLIDAFGEAGVSSVTVDGQIVCLSSTVWPKMLVERDALIAELVAHDETKFLAELSVNHQRLAAWLREQTMDDETLLPSIPDYLRDKLEATERVTVSVRKK